MISQPVPSWPSLPPLRLCVLARILGHEPEDFRLTRARDVMGTPHYMAPEQVEKPQSVDHRADIYSLGVVFYEMLTGELPLGKFQPPSQKVQIDVRLDDIVLRALEKEPGRRYQHASEVKTDMETIMTEPPASTVAIAPAQPSSSPRQARLPRRIMIPAAVIALVVLAIGLAWALQRSKRSRLLEPAVVSPTLSLQSSATVAPKPETATGWYYVSGEVRTPSRRAYDSRVTLLQAITSAADFTDFADKESVKLTRADGHSEIVNCLKALDDPSLDPDIHPGDTIHVGRRFAPIFAPNTPAPATSDYSVQAAQQPFTQRYGLAPPAPSPGAPDGPEKAFARRYGLRPSAPSPATAVTTPGSPSNVNIAVLPTNIAPASVTVAATGAAPLSYQWNFVTNAVTPDSPSNVNFAVVANGTNPLSYQWYHAPNDTTGVTNPGPEGLILTRLAPLYMTLALEGVTTNLAYGRRYLISVSPRYIISVEDAAAPTPGQRIKRQFYCSIGSESNPRQPFTLRDVQGPADNPTVVLELNATKDSVSMDKDRPFRAVRGYAADLKYGPEDKTWVNKRVGSALAFDGDEYEIVAITRTEVVLRQTSNNKKWTVKWDGEVGE
jgi:hypothetical protein